MGHAAAIARTGRRIHLHVMCSHRVRTVLQTHRAVTSSNSVQTEQPTRPLAPQLSNAQIQVGSMATSIIQPDSHSSTPASQPQESYTESSLRMTVIYT